ncbi:DNA polymerase IV [Gottschalkia acidurici]
MIHLDMDAFYASVEEVDNPKLKGLPVIVGGQSEHGVVTTANYHARRYGVHSAMPGFIARQRCPNGQFLPVRMERYKEVSRQVFGILYEIADLIEPVSIDEAYLDVSNIEKNPLEIVEEIKYKVLKETGLTMSRGISYNKFLAKLASDWNKPNGIKIITKEMVPDILLPLSVSSVHGIGKKSSQKLNNIGIYTIKELMRLPEDFLVDFFGKSGREIYNRIRGIDNRTVNISSERKSIGVERTFTNHTKNKEILQEYLYKFSLELELSLKSKEMQAKTITLKIKDTNFRTQTRGITLSNHITSSKEIFNISKNLLKEVSISADIRLIGLSVSNLLTIKIEQLSIFD